MTLRRRFSPFVTALAIAFAPVALAACEVSCGSHTSEAVTAAGGHSHHAHDGASKGVEQVAAHSHHGHHHSMVADGPGAGPSSAVTGVPRACTHGSELPVVDGTAHVVVAAPPAILPEVVVPAVLPRLIVSVAVASERSPDRLALTTQLRV